MLKAAYKVEGCVPVQGTVYGVALYAGDKVAAPSAAPRPVPSSPVFFIKPRNTFLADGGVVSLPASLPALEASAVLGICFASDAHAVLAANAFDCVGGFTLAIDLAEPGDDFFRPPIREKCRDGFLPIGPSIVSRSSVAELEDISLGLEIDGTLVASFRLQNQLQLMAQVIEQMSAFMTLRAGDVLLSVRTSPGSPVRVGSRIAAVSEQLGHLECTLQPEEGAG